MKRKAAKKAKTVAKKKPKTIIAEFNKSPFILQCEDVLADNCFSSKDVAEADEFVNSVVKLLKNGKMKGKHPIVDTKWMETSGVLYPLKIPQKWIEKMKSPVLDFQFKKPQSVEVIGDWKLGAALKTVDPEVVIDVQIPSEYFGQRDHLNFIYHVKRAHYASACAVILRRELKNAKISFTASSSQLRNPDLLIERSSDGKEVLPNIKVTFSVASDAPFVVMSRLLPTKNSIRSVFVDGKSGKESDDKPTPHYNKSIVADISRRTLFSRLAQFLSTNEVAMKTYKLLKLWANRSELLKRSDGITVEALAAILVHLDRKQTISDKMELITVLSNVWTWIAETDLSEPITLSEGADTSVFKEIYDYVLLDFDGNVNFLADLSLPALGRLKREASRALRMLPSLDLFHHIFVTPLSSSLLYDQYITITLTVAHQKQVRKGKYSEALLDNGDNWLQIFVKHYVPTIVKGWEKRIPYFDISSVNCSPTGKWSVSDTRPDQKFSPVKIVLGMELQNGWNDPVTRGPVANTPEGAEFRKFWGPRSELRKFADNTICEAVVWSELGSETIPVYVLRHVLQRHFELPGSASLDSVLPEGKTADPAHFEKISQAFDELSKHLRNAKNLPLGVSNITPVSAALRKTDPYPAVPSLHSIMPAIDESKTFAIPDILKDTCPLLPTIEVKITMEKSGRWADEIPAIAKLKTALYIEIGRCLKEQFSLKCYPQKDRLYVIMEKSIVFALEIVCPKEVTILKKLAGAKEGVPKDSAASRQLEKETVYRPQMCSALTGTSYQFSSFGETCQLIRRWIASQYLLNQFDPIVIELLVAHVYLNPIGFAAPLTAYKGFVHFLHLLVDHNWLMKPLFVDFTKTWKDEDIHELSQNFLKMRAVLPPMVIITPDDPIGARFTRGLPQPVVLKRLIALAGNALKVVGASGSGANLESLFRSNIGIYDLIISLNPKNTAQRLSARPTQKIQSKKHAGSVLPVVDYDPAELFVSELRAAFDSVAFFFYDNFNPNKIGVIWKPSSHLKEMNVTNCVHRQVSDGEISVNWDAILDDIRIMGVGLVEGIAAK